MAFTIRENENLEAKIEYIKLYFKHKTKAKVVVFCVDHIYNQVMEYERTPRSWVAFGESVFYQG